MDAITRHDNAADAMFDSGYTTLTCVFYPIIYNIDGNVSTLANAIGYGFAYVCVAPVLFFVGMLR